MNKKIDDIPNGATVKDGKVYNSAGSQIEKFKGQWRVVKNGERTGWWRFHDHYDDACPF